MPGLRGSRLLCYGCAFAAVALATALRLLLDPLLGEQAPYTAYLLGIALTAWYGGLGPSLLALLASAALSTYLFTSPRGSFLVHGIENQSAFVLFLLTGAVVALLGNLQGAGRRRADGSALRLKDSASQLPGLGEEIEKVLEVAPTAILIALDPACQRITGNRAAHALYGVRGKINFSLTPPLGEEPVQDRYFSGGKELRGGELPMQRAAAQNKEIRDLEMQVVRQDGVQLTFFGGAIPLHDEHGRVRGCIAGFVDITERKKAEEMLQKQATELAAISRLGQLVGASLSLDQVSQAAIDGIIAAVAPDCALLFRRENDELLLQNYSSKEPRRDLSQMPVHAVGACLCGLAAKNGRPVYSTDIRCDPRCTWDECKRAGVRSFAALPLRSGEQIMGVLGLASATERDFQARAAFLETLADHIALSYHNAQLHEKMQVYAAGLEQQVRERKKAEESLRKLSQAVEQSPINVIITDLDGNIEYVNRRFTQVTGYTSAEVLGKAPGILKSGHTSDEEYRSLWRTIRAGGEWSGEFLNKAKNGSLFWERALITSIKDEAGRITHFFAVKEDITKSKEVEEKLEQMHLQLTHVARLSTLGEMAAELAHELNHPLYAILNYAKASRNVLAEEGPPDLDSLREWNEEIAEIALSAGEAVKRLRSFARRAESPRTRLPYRRDRRGRLATCCR